MWLSLRERDKCPVSSALWPAARGACAYNLFRIHLLGKVPVPLKLKFLIATGANLMSALTTAKWLTSYGCDD